MGCIRPEVRLAYERKSNRADTDSKPERQDLSEIIESLRRLLADRSPDVRAAQPPSLAPEQ